MADQIKIPSWFRGAEGGLGRGDAADRAFSSQARAAKPGRKARPGRFVEKNLASIARFTGHVLTTGAHASSTGLLQSIDVRARIALTAALVGAGVVSPNAALLAALVTLTAVLGAASRVPLRSIAARTAAPVVITAVMAAPVLFSAIMPGDQIMEFRPLGVEVAVTGDGVRTFGFFILRVAAMSAPVMLLGLVTRQADLFRGLGSLPLPSFFVTALFVAFRYVFILLRISEDSQLAKRSRTIDPSRAGRRGEHSGYGSWLASRAGLLFKRSMGTATEVTFAMASRGFAGRVATMPLGAMRGFDYLAIGAGSFVFFLALGA